jgi:hypothetical protein
MATELTIERAELILPHLVDCAKHRRTITYGDLGRKIGVHHRAISRPLGYIRDEICAPRGLPFITALVISQTTEMPGDNWLPEGTGHLTSDQYQEEYEKFRGEAFDCDKWDAVLEELSLPSVSDAEND